MLGRWTAVALLLRDEEPGVESGQQLPLTSQSVSDCPGPKTSRLVGVTGVFWSLGTFCDESLVWVWACLRTRGERWREMPGTAPGTVQGTRSERRLPVPLPPCTRLCSSVLRILTAPELPLVYFTRGLWKETRTRWQRKGQ